MPSASIKRRISELEAAAAEHGRGGWLTVSNIAPDGGGYSDSYFWDSSGRQYTREELDALEPSLSGIIALCWGDAAPALSGGEFVSMTWGDVEERAVSMASERHETPPTKQNQEEIQDAARRLLGE